MATMLGNADFDEYVANLCTALVHAGRAAGLEGCRAKSMQSLAHKSIEPLVVNPDPQRVRASSGIASFCGEGRLVGCGGACACAHVHFILNSALNLTPFSWAWCLGSRGCGKLREKWVSSDVLQPEWPKFGGLMKCPG
jgi:hypothetical protein